MSSGPQHERFLSLLDEHKKILFKIASGYGRDSADRDDLVQEMVFQAWRSFHRYDDRQKFSTWVYRVALNVAISFYRSESRRARTVTTADSSVLANAAGREPVEENEDLQLLHTLIGQLGPLDRALAILHLDGTAHEEIADILGISVSNVGTRLNRIKQQLRREAEKTGKGVGHGTR